MARRRSTGGTSARKPRAKGAPRKPSFKRSTSKTTRKATQGNRLTSRKQSRTRRKTNTKAGRKVTTTSKRRSTFSGKNGATITRNVKYRTVVKGGKKKRVKFVTRTVRNAAGKVVGQKSSRKARTGRAGGGRTQAQKNKGFRGMSPKKARQARQKAGNRTPKRTKSSASRSSSRKPRAARSTRNGGVTAPTGRRRRRK